MYQTNLNKLRIVLQIGDDNETDGIENYIDNAEASEKKTIKNNPCFVHSCKHIFLGTEAG